MKIKVIKNWHDQVSVRDYIIEKCIEAGENLVIEHEDELMTIPLEKLKSGTLVTKSIKSKYTGRTYNLIDFPWRPDHG